MIEFRGSGLGSDGRHVRPKQESGPLRNRVFVKVLAVIPARFSSSRFPGKVLADDTGKPLVQHTYERARSARGVSDVLVATDDERVMRACEAFGGRCVMTSAEHASGTDRIAEAAAGEDADIIVNVQADEPEIEPDYIERVAGLLIEDAGADMATLVAPFEEAGDVLNPNIVKAVVDSRGRALYFSRSAIPYDRQRGGIGAPGGYLRHLGIYAYRGAFLGAFAAMPPGRLEQIEKLEQLRALENGCTIVTATVRHGWAGIDTPEQYAAFVRRYRQAHGMETVTRMDTERADV